MVRSKATRKPPKGLASQEDLTTGFEGAEDLPTVKATKVTTSITSGGQVPKAGSSGPTFDKDDGSSDHPNVVDTVPYEKDYEIPVVDDSGSGIPMFLFIVCGAGCVAWVYMNDNRRNEVKDKAGAVMQMMGPLVQDAMAAMTEVMKTAGQAQLAARNAANAAANSSAHLRAVGMQSSYQRVGSSDNDDDLMQEEPEAHDPYANPAAGMESSFLDEACMDEPEDAPALIQQAPPLDLFADSPAPPPALDLLNEALNNSEPQTLDSMGLLDTENAESSTLDLGF
jgi:hypothetical protein